MSLRKDLDNIYKDLEIANNTPNAVLDLDKISKVFGDVDLALTIIEQKQVDFTDIVESKDYNDYQDRMNNYYHKIVGNKVAFEKWTYHFVLKEWEYDLLREI